MKRLIQVSALALALSVPFVFSAKAHACYTVDDATISKVDTAKKQVEVAKGDKTTQTFTAADKTTVTINGKTATLADIKSGDKVHVDYESDTDVLAITVSRNG
jgi:hypothetical protein